MTKQDSEEEQKLNRTPEELEELQKYEGECKTEQRMRLRVRVEPSEEIQPPTQQRLTKVGKTRKEKERENRIKRKRRMMETPAQAAERRKRVRERKAELRKRRAEQMTPEELAMMKALECNRIRTRRAKIKELQKMEKVSLTKSSDSFSFVDSEKEARAVLFSFGDFDVGVIDAHQANSLEEKGSECNLCHRYFLFEGALLVHEKYCGSGKAPTKREGGGLSKSLVPQTPQSLVCPFCGITQKNPKALQRHIKSVHDKTSNLKKCPHCDYQTNLSSNMRKHIRCRHEPWYLQCEICGKAFGDIKNLRTHKETHASSKTIPCPLCSRMFKTKACLDNHKRNIHERVIYSCKDCLREFPNHSSLYVHRRNEHGGGEKKQLVCNICGHESPSTLEASRHRRLEHGVKRNGSRLPSSPTKEPRTSKTNKPRKPRAKNPDKPRKKRGQEELKTEDEQISFTIEVLSEPVKPESYDQPFYSVPEPIPKPFPGPWTDLQETRDASPRGIFGLEAPKPDFDSWNDQIEPKTPAQSDSESYRGAPSPFFDHDEASLEVPKAVFEPPPEPEPLILPKVETSLPYLNDKPISCDLCPFRTNRICNIEEHMRLKHLTKKSVCEICGKMFGTNRNLNKHLSRHIGTAMFKCKLCPEAFTSRYFRTAHYINIHKLEMKPKGEEREFECHFCGHKTKKKDLIKRHIERHFQGRLTSRKTCRLCGEPFRFLRELKAHYKEVHDNKQKIRTYAPSVCSYCGKVYSMGGSLKHHIRKHHEATQFIECDLCDFKTHVPHRLKRHKMNKHLPKTHLCIVCGKFFGTVAILNSHMNLHSTEKQFKCDFEGCGKVFRQQSGMIQHKKKQHPPEYKKCDECGETFLKVRVFRAHVKRHKLESERKAAFLSRSVH